MKKCALVIGHKKSSPGASNKNSGTTEFQFNEKLAIDIEERVVGVEVQRVYRRTYKTLPDDINEMTPDFIISLHCNAYDTRTSGTEVLYYHKSNKGKKVASILQNKLVSALGLKNRGSKPITAEDRGGVLLKETEAPCVITEPFFIDNDDDLQMALERRDELIKAYVDSIENIAAEL